jgi:hypothetical protein
VSNKSDWKGWEKIVATALGGKRTFRTMESYGKTCSDVTFMKSFRKLHPSVKRVAIECKKKKAINVHQTFAEATSKYGEAGAKEIVLAHKVPRGKLTRDLEAFEARTWKRYIVSGHLWKRRVKKLKRQLKGLPITKKHLKTIKKSLNRKYLAALREGREKIKARNQITGLVTVRLEFFKELWDAWLQ